jgi:alkaline phosphatase D
MPRLQISRRDFLAGAGALPLAGRLLASPWQTGRRVFLHGVASGDPLADRVVLWTRVSALAGTPDLSWQIARDARFRTVVGRGSIRTSAQRDFTVKVDAGGLEPATTYYYRFEAAGEQSVVGRTRTLPASGVDRVRLAAVSCSNLPYGYFNVYGRIAERADLDAVLHLGDYIYEYANGRYGDGTKFGRVPRPDKELTTLEDYRTRHAQYKTDPDLQEAHRQHPFIVVWDDHELANNTWRDGAANHDPDEGEGEWPARRDAAIRAFFEWMPIREDLATRGVRIYRSFPFGTLADLVMLDTRVTGRDQQAARRDALDVIDDPSRTLLGRPQEEWLFAELAASKRAGVRWQLLGQQVMFAQLTPPGSAAGSTDTWDGYRPARTRVLDFVASTELRNLVVLTGDIHSSWAYDLPRDPWDGYDPASGRGTLAVEFATPAISSPGAYRADNADAALAKIRAARPHLRWAEGVSRGYVLLDVTAERTQADWFFVPTVDERTTAQTFAKGFVSEAGRPHLIEAGSPAASRARAADPAPIE